MTMKLTIRYAEPGDASVLAQLMCELGYETLIAAAEKDFAEKRVMRVSLTTRFTREHAHRFYQALGYSRTGFRFAKQLLLVT